MCVFVFFFGSRRGARGKVVNKVLWPRALHPLFNFVLFCFFCLILFLLFFWVEKGGPEARLSIKSSGLGPFTHCLILFYFVCFFFV